MLLCTTESIPGKELQVLGLVEGSVAQSKHFGKDMMAGFKTIVGGELKGYTEMMNEARSISTQRMVDSATQLGADAIIAMRYGTSSVMQGAAEIFVYGTAVKFI